MKCCILMGSPRKNGNTAKLLKPFIEELGLHQVQHEMIWLYDKHIEPCIACRNCQKDWTIFGCPHPDDMQEIFDKIYDCDVIILATPIYSWYCKHSQLKYVGMLAERDFGYKSKFITDGKIEHSKLFAWQLLI